MSTLIKGQVFTTDLIASSALFVSFLILFGSLWNISVENYNSKSNIDKIKGDYTFKLLRSEGSPPDWNKTNVEFPGIYKNGLLSKKKFHRLNNISKENLVSLFKSQGFKLKAEYTNQSLVKYKGNNLVINNSKLPKNKTIQTYRTLTIDSKSKKIIKLSFYRWSE